MRITTKFLGSSALLISLTACFSGSSYLANRHASNLLDEQYQQTQQTVAEVVQLELALQGQITALGRLSALPNETAEVARYERSRNLFFESIDTLITLIPPEAELSQIQIEGLRQQQEYLESLFQQLTSASTAD